jgi:hypothetical protein
MKKSWKITLLTLLSVVLIAAIIVPLVLLFSSKEEPEWDMSLPLIEIATQDGKTPVDKINYINSSFKLSNTDDYNFEISLKDSFFDSNSVGIRLRGNSTFGYEKKPYRIKFDKKQSLFGSKKAKNWILLADYIDISLMQNYSALKLANIFDNMYSNKTIQHVQLIINGDYKGTYLLTEQIDEKEGRIYIENDEIAYSKTLQEDYPFLVELDGRAATDSTIDQEDVIHVKDFSGFSELSSNGGFPAEIKYPESADGRTIHATEYINRYVNNAFSALFGGDLTTFQTLVDIDSFIDYLLFQELVLNIDAEFLNIYVYKPLGKKMFFGPAWDFDRGFGDWRGDQEGLQLRKPSETATVFWSQATYARAFFENMNDILKQKLKDRYDVLLPKIKETNLELSIYKQTITAPAQSNIERWYVGKNTFVSRNKETFNERFDTLIYFIYNHSEYLKVLLSKPVEELRHTVLEGKTNNDFNYF